MTILLNNDDVASFLINDDVASLLMMGDRIDALDEAFGDLGRGD